MQKGNRQVRLREGALSPFALPSFFLPESYLAKRYLHIREYRFYVLRGLIYLQDVILGGIHSYFGMLIDIHS